MTIIDVGGRKTLAWRVSNTMTPDCCDEALQESMRKYGEAGDLQYGPSIPTRVQLAVAKKSRCTSYFKNLHSSAV